MGNATEEVVELYFRVCRDCLTVSDIKVKDGVGRQLDLLAFDVKTRKEYHVETTVTHRLNFSPNIKKIRQDCNHKFAGKPKDKKPRRNNYRTAINAAYRRYGFHPRRVNRVYCCWTLKDSEFKKWPAFQKGFQKRNGIKIHLLRFRDEILDELAAAVGTSNYDNTLLRVISLLAQQRKQIDTITRKNLQAEKKARKNERNK